MAEAKGWFCALTHLPRYQPKNVMTQLFFLNPKNPPHFSETR